jgi:hypothetical protein
MLQGFPYFMLVVGSIWSLTSSNLQPDHYQFCKKEKNHKANGVQQYGWFTAMKQNPPKKN